MISLAEGLSWRWLVTLALGLAMSILAGFPAVTAVVFASAVMLALLLILFRQAQRCLLVRVAVGVALSLLLTAVQLLPTFELISWSVAAHRGEWDGAGGGPLRGLGSLLIPNFNGVFDIQNFKLPYNPTFLYLYCGIPALMLAFAGAVTTRRLGALFSAMTLCATVWMMGAKTPLGVWVASITPGVIKAPLYAEFAMPAFVLGISVLAALGAERWIAPRRAWIGYTLIVIAAADLTFAGSGLPFHLMSLTDDPGVSVEQFEGSRAMLHRMQKLVNQSLPPARIEGYNDSRNWATAAPITNLPTANGDDPLALARIVKVRSLFAKGAPWERYYTLSNLNSPMLDLLNIRFVLTWAPSDQPALHHPKSILTERLLGHQVYENRDVLPRYFLVAEVRGADNIEGAIAALTSPGYDPHSMAVVEGYPSDGSPRKLPAVEVVSYGDTRIELAVNTPVPSYLVTSETWHPGWHERIDGREEPLLITNAAFRGLPVPAGRHRISMYFAPASFWLGAGITLLASLALSFLAFCQAKARSSAPGPPQCLKAAF
ncbi:MAG: YfhO family protein [Acidobacteria bacterium]|nr:YfhO family protein [Acidobacteriota bacterium]